jgi:hypothetical protein
VSFEGFNSGKTEELSVEIAAESELSKFRLELSKELVKMQLIFALKSEHI